MDENKQISRRKMLGSVATAGIVALSGCSTPPDKDWVCEGDCQHIESKSKDFVDSGWGTNDSMVTIIPTTDAPELTIQVLLYSDQKMDDVHLQRARTVTISTSTTLQFENVNRMPDVVKLIVEAQE